MPTLISGFSREQYKAYLNAFPAHYQASDHWVAQLRLVGSSYFSILLNRLVYLFLSHCRTYPDNSYLLSRFQQHKFVKIESMPELKTAIAIFKGLKECPDLLESDMHRKSLDEIDLALREVEVRLKTPKENAAPKPTPAKGKNPASGIQQKIDALEKKKATEMPEEGPPVDSGEGKVKTPFKPKNKESDPTDAPPPPPPPPPPGGPTPFNGKAPPPPAPPGYRGGLAGAPPAPPPSGGPKGKLPPGIGLPHSPGLSVKHFKDEPLEPPFKPNVTRDILESMTKQQLQDEIAAIETYLKKLKAIIEPIKQQVEDEQSAQEDFDDFQREMISLQKKIDSKQKVVDSLGMDSQETVLKLSVRKDETVEMPFLSEELYENLNKALRESGYAMTLSTKFLKGENLESVTEKLNKLQADLEVCEKQVAKKKAELDNLLAIENNGIPFARFKQLLADKKFMQEKWERALQNRKKQLDNLDAPVKMKSAANLAKAKTQTLTDVISANPDLVANFPILTKIADVTGNHLAQILFRGDAFSDSIGL